MKKRGEKMDTKKILTTNESQLMEIFWKENRPMTSLELADYSNETDWKSSYVFIMLKSMQKKGMIETCGSVLCGSKYVRLFRPTLTKEEYVAKFASLMHLKKSSISKITVALLEELDGDKDAIISELETMIEEFKKQKEE